MKTTTLRSVTTFAGAALLACGFLLSSCSKTSPKSNYHVTCKVDGVATNFNVTDAGRLEYQGTDAVLRINGLTVLSATAGNMGFAITNLPSGDSIRAGIYSDTQTKFEVLASYDDNVSTGEDFEAGTSTYQEAVSAGNSIGNHFTVVITELTATAAKGTFSGDFYLNGNAKATKKTITDGDFYVQLQ